MPFSNKPIYWIFKKSNQIFLYSFVHVNRDRNIHVKNKGDRCTSIKFK